LLSNQLEIPVLPVTMIYRLRWCRAWFFRWIKGPLRIKPYYDDPQRGEAPQAGLPAPFTGWAPSFS
jgi:hypothetical protein